MGESLGSNIAALSARRYMALNNSRLKKIQGNLSSGSRISDPSNEPANAAVSYQISAQIRGIKAASQNVAQAESLLQFAAGALASTQELLINLDGLAVQANSDLLEDVDRDLLNQNFQSILTQVQRNAEVSWGQTQLLTGGLGAANFVDAPNATATESTSGYVFGSVDANSVNVRFTGADYQVTLSIGGQLFQGTATPNVGGTLGSLDLTSSIDPFSKVTIANIDFDTGALESVVAESIKTATGVNTGMPIQYYPKNAMSKHDADAILSMVEPGASCKPGYYHLTYGTDGSNAVFKWQNNQSIMTTSIPITDVIAKLSSNGSSDATAFSGEITLDDGTRLTLSNFDLTNTNELPGALTYIAEGTSKTFKVQTGDHFTQIASLNLGIATVAGLGLGGENLLSISNTRSAGLAVRQAIDLVAAQIGNIGGFKSQLSYTAKNLDVLGENQTIARSEYADTDIPTALIQTQELNALVDLSSTALYDSLEKTKKLVSLVQRVQGSG